MSCYKVCLSGDHSLSIVIPAGAEATVEVQSISILKIFWGTDTSNTVSARGPNIGKTQYTALKLDVCEEMGQTKILVGVLSTKYFKEISYIP